MLKSPLARRCLLLLLVRLLLVRLLMIYIGTIIIPCSPAIELCLWFARLILCRPPLVYVLLLLVILLLLNRRLLNGHSVLGMIVLIET